MVRDRQLNEDLSDQIRSLREQVERLDHSLRGNGQPGIITRLALLDERVAALTAFADEVATFRRWVVLGVLTMIGSMVVQSIGLLP